MQESLIEFGAGGESRHQGKKSNGVVVITKLLDRGIADLISSTGPYISSPCF